MTEEIRGGALICLGKRSVATHYFGDFLLPSQPSTPDTDSSNAPQRTQTCPLAPLDARGGAGTMLSKIFHASVPIVPQEIMGQCFLHPFLIPAGYNDILCKINT